MSISILQLIAIVAFLVSVALAIVGGQIGMPLLWAVWSFAVLAVFAGVIP